MSESVSLLAELASIKTYLTVVQESLKTGYMPDITSLEKRVADVCQDIELVEDAIKKQCLPMLADILQNLDACERGMREWRDDVEKKSSAK